jgi:hypothetical protein
MIYILSCIIDKFFFLGPIGSIHQHLHLALFGSDHHRLVSHATDHVKRIPGFAPQRKLQGIFLHALFQCFLHHMLDLEKPIGRTQTPNALMRALIIVIFDPKCGPFHRIIKTCELSSL